MTPIHALHTHNSVLRKSRSRSCHVLEFKRLYYDCVTLQRYFCFFLSLSVFLKIIEIEEDGKMTILVQVRCLLSETLFFLIFHPSVSAESNNLPEWIILQSSFLNSLNPKIKIWILICCIYSFPTEVVGRSW